MIWPKMRTIETARPGSGEHWITPEVIAQAFDDFTREDGFAKLQSAEEIPSRVASPPDPRFIPLPEDTSHQEVALDLQEVTPTTGETTSSFSAPRRMSDTIRAIAWEVPTLKASPTPSLVVEPGTPQEDLIAPGPVVPNILAAAHTILTRQGRGRPTTRESLQGFSISGAWKKLTAASTFPIADLDDRRGQDLPFLRLADSPPTLPPVVASPPRLNSPPQTPYSNEESSQDIQLDHIPEDACWSPSYLTSPVVAEPTNKRQSVSKYPTPLETPTVPPNLQIIEPTPRPLSLIIPPQDKDLLRSRTKHRRRRSQDSQRNTTSPGPLPRQTYDFDHYHYPTKTARPPSRRGATSPFGSQRSENASTGSSWSFEIIEVMPSPPTTFYLHHGERERRSPNNFFDGPSRWAKDLKALLSPGNLRPKPIKNRMRNKQALKVKHSVQDAESVGINVTGDRYERPLTPRDENSLGPSCCVVA